MGQCFQMLEEQRTFCPLPASADPSRTTWAGETRTWSELGAPRVLAPPRPSIELQHLELKRWFVPAKQRELTARRMVCAVHVERSECPQPGAYFVTSWSRPVELWPEHAGTASGAAAPPSERILPSELLFEFPDDELPVVSGDVRISFFDLDELLTARAKREAHGTWPRLPFDQATSGPWGGDGTHAAAGGTPDAEEKMAIAGKEPGCLFFWLFHTGKLSDFLPLTCCFPLVLATSHLPLPTSPAGRHSLCGIPL